MNERMYELINEAFIGTTDGKLSSLNTVVNIEKFAELIVEECVQLCQECIDDGCVEAQEPMVKIQKHFGVKE